MVDVAQTYLQTAIVTRAAFNTNPLEFVTGMQTIGATTRTESREFGSTGVFYDQTVNVPAFTGYAPILNGTALTLPELLGFDSERGEVSFGSGGIEAIKANIALNGGIMKPIVQTIGLNVGFAVGKRLFSKQRTLMNKAAKFANVGSMVKF